MIQDTLETVLHGYLITRYKRVKNDDTDDTDDTDDADKEQEKGEEVEARSMKCIIANNIMHRTCCICSAVADSKKCIDHRGVDAKGRRNANRYRCRHRLISLGRNISSR